MKATGTDMKVGALALVAATLLGAGAASAASDPNQPVLRRFALIVSANDGGAGRPRLRYADSDARAVSEVLRRWAACATRTPWWSRRSRAPRWRPGSAG